MRTRDRLKGSRPPKVSTSSTACSSASIAQLAAVLPRTDVVIPTIAHELIPVNAEVPFGDSPAEQARRIVEAQVQPPVEGTLSAIPAGTKVRAVYLTSRGEAYLDLSADVARGHTGGSLDEALAVFALVNVLTVNLPDITAVQILIDGKEVDTLAGHVDLRHPLRRALEWVRR